MFRPFLCILVVLFSQCMQGFDGFVTKQHTRQATLTRPPSHRYRPSSTSTTTQLFAKRRTTLSRGRTSTPSSSSESSRSDGDDQSDNDEETADPVAAPAATPIGAPTPSVTMATTPVNQKELTQLLADDISEFERSRSVLMDARERERVKSSGGAGGGSPALQSIKDLITAVLIGDFFVVIGFLVWFLFAAAMQKTNPFFLEKFQDVFQPVVVPCLTVLMAGSIASGAVENMGKKGDDDR